MKALESATAKADSARNEIHAEWLQAVQAIADKFQVEIATGHLSDTWQVNSGLGKDDFRALYDDESNEALIALEELDEETRDYGVGPSNMERFKPSPPPSSYDQQAADFLAKHGLKFRITQGIKSCPWSDSKPSGHHYKIAILRAENAPERYVMPIDNFPQPMRPDSLCFDLWGSIADREGMQEQNEEMKTAKFHACHPSAYDVLACISGDVHCPETFEDFCAEYGYDEDSRKAEKQFKACHSFAKKLKAFFTEQEIEELSEIQ